MTAGDFGHRLSFAIFAGLVFGKRIGVLVFSWVASRLGLANLAYDLALLAEAKLGILIASATSAIIGILLLAWLSLRKQAA